MDFEDHLHEALPQGILVQRRKFVGKELLKIGSDLLCALHGEGAVGKRRGKVMRGDAIVGIVEYD